MNGLVILGWLAVLSLGTGLTAFALLAWVLGRSFQSRRTGLTVLCFLVPGAGFLLLAWYLNPLTILLKVQP